LIDKRWIAKALRKSISLKQKELADSAATSATKRKGAKNEGKSNDVIENKWRENVSFLVHHDVIGKNEL